jgi:hypothetical protein
MKIFILVDENNIIRCIASEEVNLHADKLDMDKYYVEMQGAVGDEYDSNTDTWTPRPENYPQPTQDQIDETKISDEMLALQRTEAIQSLIVKGDLPPDYTDIKG